MFIIATSSDRFATVERWHGTIKVGRVARTRRRRASTRPFARSTNCPAILVNYELCESLRERERRDKLSKLCVLAISQASRRTILRRYILSHVHKFRTFTVNVRIAALRSFLLFLKFNFSVMTERRTFPSFPL